MAIKNDCADWTWFSLFAPKTLESNYEVDEEYIEGETRDIEEELLVIREED